jgi:hypothetical protein
VESFRKIIGAVYVALATAAGPDVLAQANVMLQDGLDAGSVNDPYVRSVLEALIRTTTEQA